jgi:hypothetical protein
MTSRQLLHEFRLAVTQVKDVGRKTIRVSALERFLNELEGAANEDGELDGVEFESKLAAFRAENERNIAQYQAQQADALEMFRSVIQTGQSALKGVILINGGAAVAMLAFIGNLATRNSPNPMPLAPFTLPMLYFAFGVLAGALAGGGTYLTQLFYSQARDRTGVTLHVVTIVLTIAAYALFAAGAVTARSAVIQGIP